MSERKKVRRVFFVWDFEKEERWLNEMALSGWLLDKIGFCSYEFIRCTPGEYTIRLEMGVFTIGSNGWVDKLVFEQGEGGKMKRGFEFVDVVGEIIEEPQTYKDVKGLVVNDYQKYLEGKWLKKLRRKYKVEVDKEVLKTVNNHN